ncbi:hypothetical protein C479_07568 [Halovivax asiaticus JCM 14624]|uniref:Uncharacterized protein n=1 Tax=Halovivax asiaticus JCM 14624 TaxID=1227490 RepID=M0BNF8_9EURY|nr:hypothetical protein [Halovivax asiaticus]ELZ11149.1 hypothetical protein C479_07568 [Halovivax asiaticus JCM 14624]
MVDRLDAVTTVLLPVTDGDRWTLSASTLEVQLSIDLERPVSPRLVVSGSVKRGRRSWGETLRAA